jgi:poly(ADP-ribose) glycohydrolase
MIEDALTKPIKSSLELEAAIMSYNTKYASSWKFITLHEMFEKEFDEEESAQFFNNLLPKIVKLALQCPVLIATAIPLLKKKENRTVSLSQQQVACLLANAFLCTFPKRNTMKRKSEYCRYPDINFNRLFQTSGQSCIEKIKSLCHYFLRVCNTPPIGVVTFQRRYISGDDFPKWDELDTLIGNAVLHMTSEGTIEDDGGGLLQVDFANK